MYQAQLDNLRLQVNPHMLLNSFNRRGHPPPISLIRHPDAHTQIKPFRCPLHVSAEAPLPEKRMPALLPAQGKLP